MGIAMYLYFLSIVAVSSAAKVLVTVPGLVGSQNLIMYRLGETIAQAGHDVTVFKYIILPEAKSPPLTHAKDITYTAVTDDALQQELRHTDDIWEPEYNPYAFIRIFRLITKAVATGCRGVITDTKLIERLKAEKFDVMIIHLYDICGFGLTELLGIQSYIWMSTTYMLDSMAVYSGTPMPLSYVPSVQVPLSDQMTFGERAKNLAFYVVSTTFLDWILVREHTLLFREIFGHDFPDIRDIIRDTSLTYINADPFFDYARPTAPNVVYVGGLTMQLPDKLSSDWLKLVTNERATKHGVIVFSLGTVANTTTMPFQIKTALFHAFKKLPHQIIWRVEGKLPEGVHEAHNIHITNWIPQKDLLAHENIKLFITHGGYNSLTEATWAGVPLVALPLFSDQFANTVRIQRFGIGVGLNKYNITEETVTNAIHTVLNNTIYQKNARRIGNMIRKKPVSSAELAVKWVEFLAEFKTLDNLQPMGKHMGFVKYFMLDVIAVLSLTLAAIVFAGLKICMCCCRVMRGGKHSREGKSKKSKKE